MKLNIKNIAFLLMAALSLAACNGNKQGADEASETKAASQTDYRRIAFTAEQYKLADIETGCIKLRVLGKILKLNGKVEAEPGSIASVSAPLGGYIKTSSLIPGQEVRKGAVLATLESPEFIDLQEDYHSGMSRLAYMEKEYERQKTLRRSDITAEKTFQQTESEYRILKTKVAALKEKLDLIGISTANGGIVRTAKLRAPISGFVKSNNAPIGKYAQPSDVLFEIEDKRNAALVLRTFEKDLPMLHEGQTVKFSLATEDDYSREAVIRQIGTSSDGNGTIPVSCRLTASSADLVPGMYVKAWVETDKAAQQAVPTEALVQIEGQDYLIVERADKDKPHLFTFYPVKKGVEEGGWTAVTLPSAIQVASDKIVVKNAYLILSALKNEEEAE